MHFLEITRILLASAAIDGGGGEAERYRAWLDVPGGELPFELLIDGDHATLINGSERDDAPRVSREGDSLSIEMDYFGSRIEARVVGARLEGVWRKTRGGGREAVVPFHATRGDAPRFAPMQFVRPDETPPFTGRWLVRFESSEEPAIGVFTVGEDGVATGTFMTTTGDYRFLAGRQDGPRLRLSCFDGAHAFLFDAHADEHGALRGTFRSGDWWEESWTATRAPDAALADGWTQTTWDRAADLGSLRFPALDGSEHAVSEFLGERGMVIKVFGSWCPNCPRRGPPRRRTAQAVREAGDRLPRPRVRAHGRPGARRPPGGAVRRADRHRVSGPRGGHLRQGQGRRSRSRCSTGVRSFPTTIFVGPDGNILAVHTGYSGPATGDAHDRLTAEFDQRIESMLD